MYIIVDLIIFVFVLICRVFIGLFIMLMSLERIRHIHRRLMGMSTVIDPHQGHNKLVACWDTIRFLGVPAQCHNKTVFSSGI
jgi:hypothetical protein